MPTTRIYGQLLRSLANNFLLHWFDDCNFVHRVNLNEAYVTPFWFDRPHGEWSLISSSVFTEELHEIREDGVVEIYSQLDIFVKMERKSSYYVTSVLLPIVLTSFLSLFVFLLPVKSGEKVYILEPL